MILKSIVNFLLVSIIFFIDQLPAQTVNGLKGGSLYPASIGGNSLSINPANFWISKKSSFSIMLPLSLQLHNNSVSPNWLNTYLLSGKYMDNETVNTMLDEIPDSGLLLNGHGNIMLFGLSYKRLAIYIGGTVDVYGTIPKSLFETGFQGIEFERNIDLNNTQFGFQSYLPISFILSRNIGNNLYAGIGIKGLMGIGYFDMSGAGEILSQSDNLSGVGTLNLNYSLGEFNIVRDSLLSYSTEQKFSPGINGKGYAIDIGITKVFSDSWTMGFTVQNIFGTINWNGESSYRQVLQFDVELFSDEFEEIGDYSDSQQDSLLEAIITEDNVYSIDNLKTIVPIKIELNNELQFGPKLLLFNSISYEAASDIISEFQFELSGGLRWLYHRRFPVTLGITHSSLWGLKWGGGVGIHLSHYHLDILFSQNGGFSNEAKGFSLNLINYIYF